MDTYGDYGIEQRRTRTFSDLFGHCQLRLLVSQVLRQEAPEVQDTAAQAARKEPEALPHLDPHQSHPHPTHPAPVMRPEKG
jgi:hypothetical protein